METLARSLNKFVFPAFCLRKSERRMRSVVACSCKSSDEKLGEIVSSISESEIEPELGLERRQRRHQDGGENALRDFTSHHFENWFY